MAPIVFQIRLVIYCSPLLANSLLFDSYRPQHICTPLLTLQILSSWPVLPTFSFMACVRPCLYINDQYFDSQALSLTWFPIQRSWKLPSVTSSLTSKLWVVSSSTRDALLVCILATQVQLSTSHTIKASWSLNRMGLPSCHIHQKALGSLCSLHLAFLLPLPLLHLADSFPAQPKKPPKSQERALPPIWILSAQWQRDVLACLPRGNGATTNCPLSASKKKQYNICNILMAGSFGKVMVLVMVSQVCTLTLKPQMPHHGHHI